MAASATFALKVDVWFRRGRLLMVSPDSLGTACPLSGRNSTYRPVRISETSSDFNKKVQYPIGKLIFRYQSRDQKIPGGRKIAKEFESFRRKITKICETRGLEPDELTFADYAETVAEYLAATG